MLEARPQENGWTVVSSTQREIVLSYKPKYSGFSEIRTTEGKIVYNPVIAGTVAEPALPGAPLTLIAKELIGVPCSDGFYIDYIDVKSVNTHEKPIAPVPAYRAENGEYIAEYSPDAGLYNSAELRDWVDVRYEGIARNRHIASVTIRAAQYNPESQSIEIPSEIIISIKFKNIKITNVKDDYPYTSVLNKQQSDSWLIDDSKGTSVKGTDMIQGEATYPWAKIGIDQEGIYQIDASQLKTAGITVPKDLVGTVKIFGRDGTPLNETVVDSAINNMNEIPVIVRTNSSGELESVVFYGRPGYGFEYNIYSGFCHYINPYSNLNSYKKEYNYYFITYGGTEGKRLTTKEPPDGSVVNSPSTYTSLIYYEEESTNAFMSGSGRFWFGSTLFPRTFSDNILTNLDKTGTILYKFAFAHTAAGNGTFSVYESGTFLNSVTLSLTSNDGYRGECFVQKPATIIGNDLRSVLKMEYSNTVTATPYFDWYEIQYPRYLIPSNNEIGFFDNPALEGITEYSINDFSGDIIGLDVSNGLQPTLLKNLSNVGSMFIFRHPSEKKNPGRFFISANYRKPPVEKVTMGNLRTSLSGADVIVITHPDFVNSAEKFKEYRSSRDGLSVTIVKTTDIYNEFGYGIGDPTAIRDFIAFAFNNWQVKPRYVLLWGDGHYDYKNISTTKTNYVITYQNKYTASDLNGTNSYTSDNYFAQVKGNDIFLDLAIGRVTIGSDAEGKWFVEKLGHYENESSQDQWRTVVTLCADDGPKGIHIDESDYDTHTVQSEGISNHYIPSYFQQKKVYLAEYPRVTSASAVKKPAATNDMLEIINTTGTSILSWVGHGNPRVWAHEELLERSTTIPKMTNLDKLFFATAATCDFGRFDMPEVRSGAEELVLSDAGGAIGILSASRAVYAAPNISLLENFITELFTPDDQTKQYPRVGDAFFMIKQKTIDTSNDAKYYILGDPTMRLLTPVMNIRIDSLNGQYVGDNSDTAKLKALGSVEIKGSVIDPVTSQLDAAFNGTVLISMLDSDEKIVVEDADIYSTIHTFYKQGSILNKSSYKVENGCFTANFVLPKDISYSDNTGRLFAYAFSSDNKYAKGNNNNFTVKDISTDVVTDVTGPDIRIYLDSRGFAAGDIVSPEPLLIVDLADETGINTTGRGVGHRIEAWIDDSSRSVDLTNKFSTSLTDSRQGTAETFLYDLKPGDHTVRVRVWDVYNNYSIAQTNFRILDNRIVINDLLCYPNPAEPGNTVVFKFEHNLTPPFDAKLRVFNIMGQLLYTVNTKINTLHTGELEWNCKDGSNTSISSGSYLYQIILESDTGNIGTNSSILNYVE